MIQPFRCQTHKLLGRGPVAFDDEDSVWVFPECKYNDITSNSSEFVPGDFVLIKTLVVK